MPLQDPVLQHQIGVDTAIKCIGVTKHPRFKKYSSVRARLCGTRRWPKPELKVSLQRRRSGLEGSGFESRCRFWPVKSPLNNTDSCSWKYRWEVIVLFHVWEMWPESNKWMIQWASGKNLVQKVLSMKLTGHYNDCYWTTISCTKLKYLLLFRLKEKEATSPVVPIPKRISFGRKKIGAWNETKRKKPFDQTIGIGIGIEFDRFAPKLLRNELKCLLEVQFSSSQHHSKPFCLICGSKALHNQCL